MKVKIFCASLLLTVMCSYAQVAEEQVDDIQKQYTELKNKVDSLQKALSECRSNYDSDPNKYGTMIVALESELFDANQKYSVIERKYSSLIKKGDSEKSAKVDKNTAFNGKNIANSPYVLSNVPKSDVAIITNGKHYQEEVIKARATIDVKYDSLQEIKQQYDKASSQDAVDQLLITSERLKQEIKDEDAKISDSWVKYYNVKTETYLVLIDKLGNIPRAKLESLDLLSRQAQSSVDEDETYATCLADFKAQNDLILAYEELLADKLGYKEALDSIHVAQTKFKSVNSALYPLIDFPYRSVCIYGNITLGNSYSYSTVQEIPQVKLPETGVYYSVQLYMSQNSVKQLSTFKGAEPLMLFQSGGYYRYLAGGYRTYSEASKEVSKMLKAGFKAPRVVAWLNGKITTLDKAKAAESSLAQGGYVLEIRSENSSIETAIKEIVTIHAKGVNWTKSSEGNKNLYRLMTFKTKEEAEVIAQIIKMKNSSVELKVVENK